MDGEPSEGTSRLSLQRSLRLGHVVFSRIGNADDLSVALTKTF